MRKLLAYLQLLRLPNVFTAMADVFMGFLVSHGSLGPWTEFVPLLVASSCIYLAGMVWNDWFDIEVDRQERPERPLPSGRIAASHALLTASMLLVVGMLVALMVSSTSRNVAIILVACVLLYDGLLKQTLLGPAVMGLCRALNVLLGMSSVPGAIWIPFGPEQPLAWRFGTMVAAGLGLYVMGVTRFARREAVQSARIDLTSSTLGFNLGLFLVAVAGHAVTIASPVLTHPGDPYWLEAHSDPAAGSPAIRFYTAAAIWGAVILITNAMVWRAVADSVPLKVQQAVKTCIVAIIGIDAAVVGLVNGLIWACVILLLLLPTLTLGRWVYST